MSFDGDGDREEDDVRTLCTYIIPPVFTDAFMQTLKDKKKKTCPVLEGTEPSSSLALIILPSSLSGPSCQYLLRHCDSFLFICLRNSPLPPPGIGKVSKFRLLCFLFQMKRASRAQCKPTQKKHYGSYLRGLRRVTTFPRHTCTCTHTHRCTQTHRHEHTHTHTDAQTHHLLHFL